jgi:transcriptional regulator with XRE-family HTH domain
MSTSTSNLRSQSFSERLQGVLAEKGISQKKLSDRIFISPSTVTRWFTGDSSPQPRTIEAIANAIGVRKEWLLTGEGERDAPDAGPGTASVRESAAGYETVKHVIFIEETGTPEQIALVKAFLKSVRDQIAHAPGGHTEDRSGDR